MARRNPELKLLNQYYNRKNVDKLVIRMTNNKNILNLRDSNLTHTNDVQSFWVTLHFLYFARKMDEANKVGKRVERVYTAKTEVVEFQPAWKPIVGMTAFILQHGLLKNSVKQLLLHPIFRENSTWARFDFCCVTAATMLLLLTPCGSRFTLGSMQSIEMKALKCSLFITWHP